jgi:hypothetical protein
LGGGDGPGQVEGLVLGGQLLEPALGGLQGGAEAGLTTFELAELEAGLVSSSAAGTVRQDGALSLDVERKGVKVKHEEPRGFEPRPRVGRQVAETRELRAAVGTERGTPRRPVRRERAGNPTR